MVKLRLAIQIDRINVQHSHTHENEATAQFFRVMLIKKYVHTKAQLQVYMKAIPKIDVIVQIWPILGVNSGLVMQWKS